jgi:hypothetical protein
MADRESYVKEAFLNPLNLAVLGGAALLALVAFSAVPLLVGLGAEVIYLGTLPSLPGFQRRVRRRRDEERRQVEQVNLEKTLDELSPNQRDCYLALRELRERTLENYRRLPGGQPLAESSAGRLDGLLVSFVRLLGALDNYRKYLSTTDRRSLERELAELRVEVAGGSAGTSALREVKRRRVEILEKRVERFERAAESRELVSHQLASIEDVLRLLHEQSITLRDPEIVNAQLEHLSFEIQATDDTMRETERFLAFSEEVRGLSPPERERVR